MPEGRLLNPKIKKRKEMPNQNSDTQLAERLAEVERRLDGFGPIEEILSRIESNTGESAAPKEVLTLEEASEFLGVSKSQLYKLTRTAAIPHYKPNGKYIYFDRAELIEWVKQNPVRTRKQHELDAVRYVTAKPIKRR